MYRLGNLFVISKRVTTVPYPLSHRYNYKHMKLASTATSELGTFGYNIIQNKKVVSLFEIPL